jgi:hypothetical protein
VRYVTVNQVLKKVVSLFDITAVEQGTNDVIVVVTSTGIVWVKVSVPPSVGVLVGLTTIEELVGGGLTEPVPVGPVPTAPVLVLTEPVGLWR